MFEFFCAFLSTTNKKLLLVYYPSNNNNNNNNPFSLSFLLVIFCFVWCVGFSQHVKSKEISTKFSSDTNSSLNITNNDKSGNFRNRTEPNNTNPRAIITQTTKGYYLDDIFSASEKPEKQNQVIKEKTEIKSSKITRAQENLGLLLRNESSEIKVPGRTGKQIAASEEQSSENETFFKNILQKDDVHIKIIDTDARFRRGPNGPYQRWRPSNRNKGRYWWPPRRGRNWNRKRWKKWKQRSTTPMPTSTALVDKETGNRRVVITRPDRKRQPNRNQTGGGSTSISRRKGHPYWNVPPFVLKMKKKLKQKIRQMSNMLYNGLTDTLYDITRRSKYIIKTYAGLKVDSRQLISDTHDIIESIVESSNNIYDTVLTISDFDRRLFERLYEQGRSPTPIPVPDVTDLLNVNYNLVNREAFISLRTLKHIRNKFFQRNHTYARHMAYYYDRLDRISEMISSQRFRIGDMMDIAMYVSNQMGNMTKLKVPRVLRQIRDETQELITDNYKNRHRLYIAEQIHEDVTTFQKSCHLRLEELSQVNYTLLKQLPRPTIEPLTFKEKRKLQILVNRIKGHEENILRSASEIDKLLPHLINSGKSLILELSAEAQSDSHKVWALEKMMKRWYKMSSAAINGRYSKRKWMRMQRKRIKRMRKRMPKFKYPASKRRRRAVDMLQDDVEKIYDEIIQKLTDILKKLDAMWLKLIELSPRKDGKCEQIGIEGSGEDDTEVECELQGSGKMGITESESEAIPSFSLAGNNDNDDSNGDFEFTDVKTVVMSSHRESLQLIIHTFLSQSKSQQKISRNLGRDVKDIKVSLDEIKAKKMKLESDVNKSAEVVSIYDGLVKNANEMQRLLNQTKEKIKTTHVKCKMAKKVADLVLGDKDELERLLEKRIKEKEREKKNGDNDAGRKKKKKKKKKLKDKSDENLNNGRKGEKNGGKKRESVEKAEEDISRKLLRENEETKAELKELIEKYLRLQKEDKKRKNEDKNKTGNEEDSKKRRKNRRKKHSNKNEKINKNDQQKNDLRKKEKKRKKEENVEEQMKRHTDEENKKKGKRKNSKGKSRKDKLKSQKGEESGVKNKKKIDHVSELTDKKDYKVDIGSVLEIKKNLEDVLKKLNQRFNESKKRRHGRRQKGKRRKRFELESKKRSDVKSLVGKKMVSDEKENKQLNEKEKDLNENERKKKKKEKESKTEDEDLKEDMNENERMKELKKKRKKDRIRRKSKKTTKEEFEENVKSNITKNQKRKKDAKKTERKQTLDDFVLSENETVNDKNKKKFNEKVKDQNENEEKRKKKRKKLKNETKMKELKENVNETKKKHPNNENERKTNKTIEGNLEDDKKDNNAKKKERQRDVRRKKKKTSANKIMVKDENKNKKMNEEGKDKKGNKEKRTRKKSKNELKDYRKNEDEIKKNHKKDRTRKKTNEKSEAGLNEDTNERKPKEKTKQEAKKKKRNNETVSNEKGTVNDKKRKESNEKGTVNDKKRKESNEKGTVNDKKRKESNEKQENGTRKKRKRKRKNQEADLDKKKKERFQKKKSDDISAILRTALFDEHTLLRNNSRNRKIHRKRKTRLSEKIKSPPIFIQNEEQKFAEEMKNQSQQIEADVYKSKAAMESIVKQLKGFSPDPCTFMSKSIKQLQLNVSHIRQQIQLARTIVASMKIPVSVDGEDHLEVILDRNETSREIQNSAEICIKPKTSDAIILVLQANNSISYSLSLVESKPLLTILDSDGEVLQKLQADMELIQDSWYQLLIHRIGQNFSFSVNSTNSESKGITVEKFISDFPPEQIPLSLVSLGGHPQDFPISNSEKFKGCIAYLNINGHSTHIFSPYKNGLYPSICTSGCESLVNTSMVFEGNGFALFGFDKKTFDSVRLTFKTFQDTALIMAIKTKSEMFLVVTLMEGNIQVESQVRSSRIAKQSQGFQFSDGQPHTIQLTGINKELEIETSGEDVEFKEKDAHINEMIFDEGISLGGIVSNLHNESKYRSFTGCLSNVNIDDKTYNLLSLKNGRHVYEGNCQENAWISCVHFTRSSMPISLTKYDFVRSVSLMVNSQAQGVALFFQRDSKFSIKLELTTTTLEVYNYEDEGKKTVPKNNGSRFWHLLHIEDQKGNIQITVDGGQSIDVAYTKNTAGWFSKSNDDDFSMEITIGGLPESFKKHETFIGSISTLIIEHSFLNLNKEFINSNKLSTCAKPTVELFTNNLDCAELSKLNAY